MDSARSPHHRQASIAAKLSRTTFQTSRLLDFCSEKELVAQTGHDRDEWPLVIAKELLDNALDACEEANVSPDIGVTVTGDGITVTDNGPGIPAKTVEGILDYSVRVSSREAYVSPTRGAQGNALKTILAMPFVLDGNHGRVEITAHGQRHEIIFGVDRIRQQPALAHTTHAAENVKTDTVIKVWWPDSACSMLTDAEARFLQLADDYTFLNPHLTLMVDWFGKRTTTAATTRKWAKWLPSEPTSAHWYGQEDFERLISAYVAHDQDRGADRSVRELVKEFRGLTGTAK
jgi:DNA topoisomerase VI subunit B